MDEILNHWDVIVSLAGVVAVAVRMEMKIRHVEKEASRIDCRHVSCKADLDARDREVSSKLTEIQISLARVEQRLNDWFNGGGPPGPKRG